MDLIIQVRNLTHFYNEFKALDDISFDIPNGKIIGLLGPNGAGKTTLINILCTLLKPTKGSVKVLGYDVVKEPNKIRPLLGYVPQTNITLDPNLTVFDNLRFSGLLNLRNSKADVAELIKLFGLESVKDKFTYQLSGGMIRKLILARLGLSDSKLIFLDEPTAGVDVYGKAMFGEFIRSLQKALEANIVIATHDLVEAEHLCDQVIIIQKGRILTNISLQDIKAKYFKKFIIQFVNHFEIEKIRTISSLDKETITVHPQNVVSFLLKERPVNYHTIIKELEQICPIKNISIDDLSLEEYFITVIQADSSNNQASMNILAEK